MSLCQKCPWRLWAAFEVGIASSRHWGTGDVDIASPQICIRTAFPGKSSLDEKKCFFWIFLGTKNYQSFEVLFLTHANNLVSRRPQWQHSLFFFLTAGVPEMWYLCLHGIKSLNGKLSHPSTFWHCHGRDVPMVLPCSHRRPNVFREWKKTVEDYIVCSFFQQGIYFHGVYKKEFRKCIHDDFSAFLPLILISLFSSLTHFISIKL